MSWLLLSFAALLNAGGHFLMKNSSFGRPQGADYFSASFIIGILLFIITLFAYAKAQETISLTVAYIVMVGLTAIMIIFISHAVFAETFNFMKIAGILVVLVGMYLVIKA